MTEGQLKELIEWLKKRMGNSLENYPKTVEFYIKLYKLTHK